MASSEHHPDPRPFRDQPRSDGEPVPLIQTHLPPDLAAFLSSQSSACLLYPTDRGTVFVIKLRGRDIDRISGPVPIHLQHVLYQFETAPVLRTLLRFYDLPRHPLAVECFTNVADPEQHADFARLGEQPDFQLLFYNEELAHRLTKLVRNGPLEVAREILTMADQLRVAIPPERYDFDRAKLAVLSSTRLDEP